jgi:hypothetical protein
MKDKWANPNSPHQSIKSGLGLRFQDKGNGSEPC